MINNEVIELLSYSSSISGQSDNSSSLGNSSNNSVASNEQGEEFSSLDSESSSDFGSQAPSVEANSKGQSANEDGCCSCDNSEAGSSNEYVPGTFEGLEKTMEVYFAPSFSSPNGKNGNSKGLRALSRNQLDQLCTEAKCTILSSISNEHMDAYVLSESSLFVYDNRIMMKTCGTTTLLHCLNTLIQYADSLNMDIYGLTYSRKNLLFPTAQAFPHSKFSDEIGYLRDHCEIENRLKGTAHVIGPTCSDHWFVFAADHPENVVNFLKSPLHYQPTIRLPIVMSLMMFNMNDTAASVYYKDVCSTGKEMTERSGIRGLVPGYTIDDCAFTPCGYSMNSFLDSAYATIHVTPEPQCSYASFETNAVMSDYRELVGKVLAVFQPQRFVITMFGDETELHALHHALPTMSKVVNVENVGCYLRSHSTTSVLQANRACLMGCFSLHNALSM